MYDKIELIVNITDRDYSVSIEDEASNINYDRRFYSRIKNFIRRDSIKGYSYIRGSLAKFYFGENMTPLSFGDVKQALDKLGKAFAFNLNNATVKYLEFGSSFMIKKPACEYLQLLGNCKYFKRMEIKNQTGGIESVTYFNKKGQMKFIAYNKSIEMADNRRIIPDMYKGTNVLRLEYRIKDDSIRALIGKNLKACELVDTNVYRKLQKQFCRFYNDIYKMGRGVFINPAGLRKKTKPQIMKLIMEQLRQLQPAEFDLLLQEAQARELLPAYTFPRIRAENKANSNDYNISYANELIMELDALVKLKMSKIV